MPIRLAWVALFGLAVVLLLYRLGDLSLWDDEFFAVAIARSPTLADFWTAFFATERQPPLYHLLLHVWIRLVGSADDFLLRLPSALLGLLSIAAMGLLVRRLGGGSRPLVAAALLATSPFFVLYARMARYYALSLFLATLATVLFLDATAGPRRYRYWLGYAASAAALLLTSYPAAAVVLGHQLWFLVSRGWRQSGWRAWLFGIGLTALPVIAWLLVAAGRIPGFAGQPAPQMPQGLKGMLLDFVYPLAAFGLGETIFPWHPAAQIGFIGLAVATIAGLWRSRAEAAVRFAALMFLTTFGLAWLGFQVFVRDLPFVTLASRTIASLPFLVLIWAAGIVSLPPRVKKVVGVGLAIGVIASLANYFTGAQFHNPIYVVPTKEIVAQVLAGARPDDLVVADRDSEFGYYYGAPSVGPRHLDTSEPSKVIAALEAQPRSRVWLLTLGRDRTQAATPTELIAWLEEHRWRAGAWGFAPQDPTYRRLKEQVLGYPAYEYKAVLTLYVPE